MQLSLQNQIDKMRVGLCLVLFCALVIFPIYIIVAIPYGNYRGPGCPCENKTEENQDGGFNGNCNGTDQNGMYFCYVKKGCRNCDGGDSPTFPEYCKNYSNCRLPGNINNEGVANPDN